MARLVVSPGAQALETKLAIFTPLAPADRRALSALLDRPQQKVARGQDLVVQGGPRPDGYVLLSGWAARYKTLADGRRQILAFLTTGDTAGLFGGVAPASTSTITALSDLAVVPFAPLEMMRTLSRTPRLGAALVWSAAREQEILGEHLVSLGRRSARERVAHLFLELWARLNVRGLAARDRLQVPLTQHLLADALGLSVVHVNRTLRQLAAEGLLTVNRESVVLRDLPRLREVTGFDEDYLLHHRMPPELAAALDRAPVRSAV